jgi:hypothetical protein
MIALVAGDYEAKFIVRCCLAAGEEETANKESQHQLQEASSFHFCLFPMLVCFPSRHYEADAVRSMIVKP